MNFKKILFSIVAYAMGSAMALIGIVFSFGFSWFQVVISDFIMELDSFCYLLLDA